MKEERRFLMRVRINHEGDNQWRLTPEFNKAGGRVNGKGSLSFRGDEVAVAKLLRRLKAKDTATTPATTRSRTYSVMVQDAKSKKDNYVWVWSNLWFTSHKPFSFEDAVRVTLSDNVLVPGTNIILNKGDQIHIQRRRQNDESV